MSCARPEDRGAYVHSTLRLLHWHKTCCNTSSLGGVTWWAMVVSIKVPHAQVEGVRGRTSVALDDLLLQVRPDRQRIV